MGNVTKSKIIRSIAFSIIEHSNEDNFDKKEVKLTNQEARVVDYEALAQEIDMKDNE